MLQGGVCYNPAVIAAFQAVYGDRVRVSPYFAVSGAYGVARIASKELSGRKTSFRGLRLERNEISAEDTDMACQNNLSAYQKAKKYFFDGYERTLDSEKPTVGIPYVLLVHKLFPMFRTFFESLGYHCLLSPETNEEIIGLSQQYARAETCYPVKLIYGHMAWLAEQKVDYIFLPSVLTMKHEKSNVYHNYGCVYMQSAPNLVYESMKLEQKGIKLLNPQFSLDFGQKAMAACMMDVGRSLGKSKPHCAAALMSGAMAVRKHTEKVEKQGEELLADLKPDEKVLVMVTRTYGIEDPVLNMGIPEELLKRGYKVITISHLPAHDVDLSPEYENLYWPFGQHILSAAKMIAAHPNLYAVYLTNHGCGPDTMLSHLFQKEMGDKPYLNIEVDEHYSKVGVITRIEAFLNSIRGRKSTEDSIQNWDFRKVPLKKTTISGRVPKDRTVYLPYLYPYTQLLSHVLNRRGYHTRVMKQADEETLSLGQSNSGSKEYLSYTALVGCIMKEENSRLKFQNFVSGQNEEKYAYMIPQTEGSETDGMYARVIADLLKGEGRAFAPLLERLLFDISEFESAFMAVLAGDVVLTAPLNVREHLLKRFFDMPELTLESILDEVRKLQVSHTVDDSEEAITVIGDPYIVYHPFLHGNALEKMEREGVRIQHMPLGEYLCFMWSQRAETAGEKSIVQEYLGKLKKVSECLGGYSPYADDIRSIKEAAGNHIGHVVGGNIAYRYGKQYCVKHSKAVIHMASTYENAQTIMNLYERKQEIPTLSLSFEGTNLENVQEKLDSFLYYVL